MKTKIFIIVIILIFLGFYLTRPDEKTDYNEPPSTIDDTTENDINNILTDPQKLTEDTYFDLYMYICDKCDDGYSLENCSPSEKVYFLLYNFNGEVANGGIEQFLYNYFETVDDTLETFKKLNWIDSYTYLQKAKEAYPNKPIKMYSNNKISATLDALDEKYFDLHDNEFYRNINDYIKNNWHNLKRQ